MTNRIAAYLLRPFMRKILKQFDATRVDMVITTRDGTVLVAQADVVKDRVEVDVQ